MISFRQFIKEQFDVPPPSKPVISRPAQKDEIGDLIRKYVKNTPKDEIGELIRKTEKMPEQDKEFDEFIKRTFKFEGEKGEITTDTGGLTKYGISKNANPNVDIEKLTPEQAIKIYREKYYDELGDLSHLSKKSRIVAYDASVNHGPGFAKSMIKKIGNDPEKMLQHRQNHYNHLALSDPAKYGKYHKGWINRIEAIRKEITNMKD